jgi:hypothetical protein
MSIENLFTSRSREQKGKGEEIRMELARTFEIPPDANIFILEDFRGEDLT